MYIYIYDSVCLTVNIYIYMFTYLHIHIHILTSLCIDVSMFATRQGLGWLDASSGTKHGRVMQFTHKKKRVVSLDLTYETGGINTYIYTDIHTYIQIYIHIYIYIQIYIHIYIYKCIHIYIYINIVVCNEFWRTFERDCHTDGHRKFRAPGGMADAELLLQNPSWWLKLTDPWNIYEFYQVCVCVCLCCVVLCCVVLCCVVLCCVVLCYVVLFFFFGWSSLQLFELNDVRWDFSVCDCETENLRIHWMLLFQTPVRSKLWVLWMAEVTGTSGLRQREKGESEQRMAMENMQRKQMKPIFYIYSMMKPKRFQSFFILMLTLSIRKFYFLGGSDSQLCWKALSLQKLLKSPCLSASPRGPSPRLNIASGFTTWTPSTCLTEMLWRRFTRRLQGCPRCGKCTWKRILIYFQNKHVAKARYFIGVNRAMHSGQSCSVNSANLMTACCFLLW